MSSEGPIYRRLVFTAAVSLLLPAFSLVVAAAEVAIAPSAIGRSPGVKVVHGVLPTDDGGFFAVWSETGAVWSETGGRVFGTFLSRDGEPRDPRGTFIADMGPTRFIPEVHVRAESGGYVLTILTGIWNPERTPPSFDRHKTNVVLDPEGRVVRKETTVFAEVPDRDWPKNAAGETIAFTHDGGTTLWFVGENGERRNPSSFGRTINPLAVTPDGSSWLILAGHGNGGVELIRIDEINRQNPTVQNYEPPNRVSAGLVRHVGAAGSEMAVLWERHQFASARRFDRSLILRTFHNGTSSLHTLISKETLEVQSSVTSYGTASLAKDGDSWLVAFSWFDATGQQALRLWRVGSSTTETTLARHAHRGDEGAMTPWLAVGTRNLLFYQLPRDFSSTHAHDLYVKAFDRGGIATNEHPSILLASSRPPQSTPRAITGPHGVVAVWREGDTRGNIMLRFVTAGTPPAAISTPSWDARQPVLARNGDTYLVAWQEVRYDAGLYAERHRVMMRRFDASGIAIDAEPLVLAAYQVRGSIWPVFAAVETDGFRLAWSGRSSKDVDTVVYTTRIDARGATFAPPEALTVSFRSSSTIAVVSEGDRSAVVWSEDGLIPTIHSRVFRNGIEQRGSLTLGSGMWLSSAAAANGELLVAAVLFRSDLRTYCTSAQRFSFTGSALAEAVPFDCIASHQAGNVDIVWDAGRWWVKTAASARQVHELDAEGRLARTVVYAPTGVEPLWMSLLATGHGPSLAYVRNESEADWIDRAFLRTFPRPKARAVRP
ncbi:MAG: hypothetical protein ACXW28_00460 [Thermoanaerobaculia bacterium]